MGIIALLVVILLPSLAGAHAAAKTSICASNMRQIAVGWFIYGHNGTGVSVPGRMGKTANPAGNNYDVGNGMHYRPRWFITLGAQSGVYAYDTPSTDPADDNTKHVDNEVFLCPEAPERTNNRNYTYGYNYQFLGNSRMNDAKTHFINFPVKISRINASETVLAADSLGTAAGKPRDQRTGYRDDGTGDLFAVGNHGWSMDPPRMTATGDFCDNKNRAPEHRSGPEARHGGKANFSFADGHVEAAAVTDMGYGVNPDGSYMTAGLNVHNKRFSGNGLDLDAPDVD